MKKIGSLILVLVLSMGLSLTALAADVSISTNEPVVMSGEDVVITISMEKEVSDVSNFQGILTYNTEMLTYQDAILGDGYAKLNKASQPAKSRLIFSWTDLSNETATFKKGNVITVIFEAKADLTENHIKTAVDLKMSVTNKTMQSLLDESDYSASVILCNEHVWNDGVVEKEATCLNAGKKTYTCTFDECGATKEETLPANSENHVAWDNGVVTKEATCVDFGVKTYTCACGDFYEEEIPATGVHKYDGGSVTKEATCVTPGVKTYTCVCGDSYTEEIPATGDHKYEGVVTKEATCTEKGVMTYTCACGDYYMEEIPMVGHEYKDVVTKEATCTEKGVITYTCACGDYYTEEVPMVAHEYEGVVTKEATCTEAGVITYTCVCGDSYVGEIPMEDHVWNEGVETKEATCTEAGEVVYTCECGLTKTDVVPATNHDYKDGVCGVCGASDPNYEAEKETVSDDVIEGDTVPTGDRSSFFIWVMLFSIAVVGGVVAVIKKSKRA